MRPRTLPSDLDQSAGRPRRHLRTTVPGGHHARRLARRRDRRDPSPVADTEPVPERRPPKPDLQRTVVTGASVGALAAATMVTAAVALNGGGVGSVGAGVMVAGFDGIPFGAMIGAMVYFMGHPEEQ